MMLSVFFCFVFVFLASLIPETQGHCRNLRFTSAHIHGYWLKNHVIRTIRVSNEDICEWQCYLEPNCVSYNFKKKEETNGGHQCDLNNATYEHDNKHSGDLGKHRHFVYRGAENACAKKRCKHKATCQAGFTDKDYQCLCTLGFTGDHCENDVNECTRKTHSCDVNAKCVNTPGSYECTCKDGFHGDGKQCTDIDKCANGIHSCDDNAVCNNTLGSYNCTCKDGFYGDGTNCTDIDECANGTHSCDVNAVCNNTRGSYNCTCKDGFYGDGKNCTECQGALGMENGAISDGQITASSEWDDHAAIQGRLNFKRTGNKRGAWSAGSNDTNPWLQVDLIGQYIVTRVATQGRNDHDQWVTEYKLQYGDDGDSFQYYREQGQSTDKEFAGNTDRDTVVHHYLNPPITARYIRFRPVDWHDHISMRVELFGCLQEKPRSVTICEGNARTISCQNGEIIDVLDANYGRLDRQTCIHDKMDDIKCSSNNSLHIVKTKCNQKVSCELLASNQEFRGDPCSGTYKYLEVKYRCLEYIVGWYSGHPGHSCKHIRDSGGSRGDGEYWIDPDKSGTPLKVFCDMTTDAGGWLLISNVVIDSSSSQPQFSVETSYRGISSYHSNKMFLAKSAMTELRTHLNFTQLRFHCSKQQGRTFHVTTVANSTGKAVVQYFSGQTDILPEACGSFVRMKDDNSLLAGVCNKWGRENNVDNVGKWSYQGFEDRLYDHAAFVAGSYHWLLTPGGSRWECDDFGVGVSSGDFWKVFVR